MTLVSQIITDAYRASNIIPIGDSPDTDQITEALRYLNRIISSVFGNEVGEGFDILPIGKNNITKPSGFPWSTDEYLTGDITVPSNTKIVFNLENSASIYLNPAPRDGERFAVIDASNNFATNNVVVYGNGRNIESATSVTLSTNGYSAEWFYRGDLGNWQKYSSLAISDTFPFPEAFEDYFVTLLSVRLNPSYAVEMDVQTKGIFDRAKKQLRARYSQVKEIGSELALVKLTVERDYLYSENIDEFNRG
jgi:hypothetical protein